MRPHPPAVGPLTTPASRAQACHGATVGPSAADLCTLGHLSCQTAVSGIQGHLPPPVIPHAAPYVAAIPPAPVPAGPDPPDTVVQQKILAPVRTHTRITLAPKGVEGDSENTK